MRSLDTFLSWVNLYAAPCIVTSVIMPKPGDELHTADSCYWDGGCAIRWENKNMYKNKASSTCSVWRSERPPLSVGRPAERLRMAPPSAVCVQVAPPPAAAGTVAARGGGPWCWVDSVYWHACPSVCFVCWFVTQVTVGHSIELTGRQVVK